MQLSGAYRQYQAIGTPEMQAIWANYNTLIYDPEEARRLGWERGSSRRAANPVGNLGHDGESARRVMMDQWVGEVGKTGELAQFRQERDAYETAHPRVAEFKDWQKAVGGQPPSGVADVAGITGISRVVECAIEPERCAPDDPGGVPGGIR